MRQILCQRTKGREEVGDKQGSEREKAEAEEVMTGTWMDGQGLEEREVAASERRGAISLREAKKKRIHEVLGGFEGT